MLQRRYTNRSRMMVIITLEIPSLSDHYFIDPFNIETQSGFTLAGAAANSVVASVVLTVVPIEQGAVSVDS